MDAHERGTRNATRAVMKHRGTGVYDITSEEVAWSVVVAYLRKQPSDMNVGDLLRQLGTTPPGFIPGLDVDGRD